MIIGLLQVMSPIPSVGLSGVLWKNGLLDLNAVWDNRSAGPKDEARTWGGDRPTGRGNYWVIYGVYHCNQWGLCGVALLCKSA